MDPFALLPGREMLLLPVTDGTCDPEQWLTQGHTGSLG